MESKATTTKIQASSKVTIKIRDNFYSVEFSEERSLPDNLTSDEVVNERNILFDDVNAVVDKQAEDILKTFQPKR